MAIQHSTATSQPVVREFGRYRLRMHIPGAMIADIAVAVTKMWKNCRMKAQSLYPIHRIFILLMTWQAALAIRVGEVCGFFASDIKIIDYAATGSEVTWCLLSPSSRIMFLRRCSGKYSRPWDKLQADISRALKLPLCTPCSACALGRCSDHQ